MTLRLKNSLIKDRNGKTKYKVMRVGGKRHFHVGVWLDADDPQVLDSIVAVKYKLHDTFANAERESRNRNNDFSITFWTWGAFAVNACAVHADGTETKIEPYVLQFASGDFKNVVDVSNGNLQAE